MDLTIPLSAQAIRAAWLAPYSDPKDFMLDGSRAPFYRTLTVKPFGLPVPVPVVCIASYDGVRQALTSPHLTRNIMPAPRWLRRRIHPFYNSPVAQPRGPRHQLLRKLFSDIVTPHAVADMLPRAETLANSLLQQAVAVGDPFRLDKITDLVTYEAICMVLGVADELRGNEHRERYFDWLDELMRTADSSLVLPRPSHMEDWLDEYIDRRLSLGLGGPIDQLLLHPGLRRFEVVAELLFKFVSATATTSHAVNSAVAGAVSLDDHDQFDRIHAASIAGKRPPIQRLYDEALRSAGPAPKRLLIVKKPCVIDGKKLYPGQFVEACFASANRDPRVFTDPHTFNPERPRRPAHLAFGDDANDPEPYKCPGEGYSAALGGGILNAWFKHCAGWGISYLEFPGKILIRPRVMMCPPVSR